MRFAFVAGHRTVWQPSWLCSALGVSRSGFRARPSRRPSRRALDGERIAPAARASFLASGRTYGARRVWRGVLADGTGCGPRKIERRMRQRALRARPGRRGPPPDEGERTSGAAPANILDRRSGAPGPNRKRAAASTYVRTAGGRLCVAVVLGLFPRRVVGRSMGGSMGGSMGATMAAQPVAGAPATAPSGGAASRRPCRTIPARAASTPASGSSGSWRTAASPAP